MHPRPAQQRTHFLRVDLAVLDHLLIARGEPPRHLACHSTDLPLELTHAALACVVADHHRDRVVGHRDVLVAEARFLELTRNQITLGDFCFLGFGISGEIDHFHPIEQRSRNVLDEIRRADEQHLAQIERHT